MNGWTIGWWCVAAGWEAVILLGADAGHIGPGLFTLAAVLTVIYGFGHLNAVTE